MLLHRYRRELQTMKRDMRATLARSWRSCVRREPGSRPAGGAARGCACGASHGRAQPLPSSLWRWRGNAGQPRQWPFARWKEPRRP